MQTKYFKVIAKCGHVGRDRYYAGVFYERAQSKKEAAAIVRYRPRVKHDHKDAILSVCEITETEYSDGVKQEALNPYFKCKNRREQWLVWEEVQPFLYEENKEPKHVKPKTKKPYKREKANNTYYYDLINI